MKLKAIPFPPEERKTIVSPFSTNPDFWTKVLDDSVGTSEVSDSENFCSAEDSLSRSNF